MEILKKYIRKENAHVEHLECNCIQTNIDFNRQFQFDNKVTSQLRSGVNFFVNNFRRSLEEIIDETNLTFNLDKEYEDRNRIKL